MSTEQHTFSDLNELADLAHSTYSSGEIIHGDYLKWEYLQNPFGGGLAMVEREGRKLVSQYVVVPRQYVFGSDSHLGSLSLNTITHPAHRGKGHFSKLAELTYTECEKKNIDFTVGFPNANSVNGFLGRLKFNEIGRLPLFIKIVNPFRSVYNFIFNLDKRGEIEIVFEPSNSSYSNFNFDNDSTKYKEFIQRFNQRNLIATNRNLNYLKWRYEEIPYRKYQIFKSEEKGEISSIVVMRAKFIHGVRVGIVVDLLCDNQFSGLKSLFKSTSNSNLDLFVSTVPDSSIEKSNLTKSGFLTVPKFLMFKKLHMIIRSHSKDLPKSFSDFKKWFITFGDYDIF